MRCRSCYLSISLVLFGMFQAREANSQKIFSIPSLKTARNRSTLSFEKRDTGEIKVQGYFFKDPVPLLLTDIKWARINSRMPDSVYITLAGEKMPANASQLARYQGAYIQIKGRVNIGVERTNSFVCANGERVEFINADLIPSSLPKILRPPARSVVIPTNIDICKKNPNLCRVANAVQHNYALLYSGGIDIENAHSRYWNDLKFMYNVLKSQYGYDDDHIVVLYKDGKPEDQNMIVDQPANSDGFDQAIAYLSERLNTSNDLFIFVTNHGGGYHQEQGVNYSGVPDIEPFDEIDPYRMDETTFYYKAVQQADLNDVTLIDDIFAAKINRLQCRQINAVFEQCFGGGFLRDMRGPGRVLISAASEFEFSWSGAPNDHDLFSYYFTAALNQAEEDGTPIRDADTDHDGKISLLEAFIYARNHDNANESPQLEDTGDGVGSNDPRSISGRDGFVSSSRFLNK